MRGAHATVALLGGLLSCTVQGAPLDGLSSFAIDVMSVNGGPLPTKSAPLPANRGERDDRWEFAIEARSPTGALLPVNGMVRLRSRPGAIVAIEGEGAVGRNIELRNGRASGIALVTATYGEARLWVEDLGYEPAALGSTPACANGVDDDGDGLIDFPSDPGCAFADDDTEEGGTYAAGVSPIVHYSLPTIADIQGYGSVTPYPYEGMEVKTIQPQHVVVTRVARDGFYVTDVADVALGYNHIFAFNFSTPSNMRVCDRLEFLSGTVVEFFGFTELTFPSYRVVPPRNAEDCQVPEPVVLDAATILNPETMERYESGLVRVEGYHIASNFGPKPAHSNVFLPDQSNCDLDGDGRLDFFNAQEASCANACNASPECAEWNGYASRGNYKVAKGASVIQVNTGSAPGFEPPAHRGETLDAVTGTMRNFSGGSLNWTIEARCADDLVCTQSEACVPEALSSKTACVRLRTTDDNDEGTN